MHTTVIVIVAQFVHTTCRPLAIAAWAPGWLLAQAGTKTISSFSGNTLVPDIKAYNVNDPNAKSVVDIQSTFPSYCHYGRQSRRIRIFEYFSRHPLYGVHKTEIYSHVRKRQIHQTITGNEIAYVSYKNVF